MQSRHLIIALALILSLIYSFSAHARERIVITGDRSYAPMEFTGASGEPRGMCVDIWKLWSKKTGIKIEYRLMDWADAQKEVLSGNADAVGGMFFSPRRNKVFELITPYLDISTYIYFDKNITGIKDCRDLSGFEVGIVKGDRAVSLLREKDSTISKKFFPSYKELLQAAKSGKIKVFICDAPIAAYYLAKYDKQEAFRRTTAPLIENNLYVAVVKGRPALVKKIRQGFYRIDDSEINKIRQAWLGKSWTQKIPWAKILWLSLAGLLVLVAVVFWNFMLRKKIALATREMEENNRRLKQTEMMYDTLITQTETAYAIFNPKGVLLDANSEFVRLTGRTYLRELKNEPLASWVTPEDRKRIKNIFSEIAPANVMHHVDFSFSRADSEPVKMLGNMAGVESDSGHVVMLLCWDITERRLQEEARMKIDKLESIGILAGGIAHDFNNILSAISSNISLARGKVPADSEVTALLNKTESSIARAQGLTTQLLTFSKGGEPVMHAVDIEQAIDDTLKYLRMDESIRIERDFAPDLALALADPGQMTQVFQNLLINSSQAMPFGGKIKISARNLPESDPPMVRIKFEDNGSGIEPECLKKIFDPYFTTKKKGSGLGLASVFSIIRKHNGNIEADSSPGEGTAFTITLPAARKESCKERQAPGAEKISGTGGQKTVLVMDDDEMILDVAENALIELGYIPLTAENGERAVRIYEREMRRGRAPDAVITDLSVAEGMGGRETAAEILEMDPNAKLIVSSGYCNDPVMAEYAAHGFTALLKKPYTIRQLGDTLQEIFSGHAQEE